MVNINFDKNTFYEQKNLWEEAHIKNYKFQHKGFGSDDDNFEEIITVKNGLAKSNLENHIKIDDIYNAIELMYLCNINNNIEKKYYYLDLRKLYVKYDKINHIPIEIKYYWNYNYITPFVNRIFGYIINNFEIINEKD